MSFAWAKPYEPKTELGRWKYTVTAWHEDYGTQTQEVTITGNETKSIDFTFKAKAY